MRYITSLWLIIATFLMPISAHAAGRVALVIGNSNYAAASRLANPAQDTRLVGDSLRKSGFEVVTAADTSLAQFRAALREFRNKAAGAEVAMVYYAGHGIEANGRNWLLPVDARLESAYDLQDEAIDLDRVLEALSGAKVRIAVLDACRNNPYGRTWQGATRAVTRGLARVEYDDVLILYAAAPGQVAQDGTGGNSPFAKSLAARLQQPGLPLQMLGGMVRDDVMEATEREQRPFVSASMTGTPIFLVPDGEEPAAPARPPVSNAPLIVASNVASPNAPSQTIAQRHTENVILGDRVLVMDGFTGYERSGYSFKQRQIKSWGDMASDIGVSNSATRGPQAMFYLPSDQVGADAGIAIAPIQNLRTLKDCEEISAFDVHFFAPSVGTVYCVKTRYGEGFAKVLPGEITADHIVFDWVYQER